MSRRNHLSRQLLQAHASDHSEDENEDYPTGRRTDSDKGSRGGRERSNDRTFRGRGTSNSRDKGRSPRGEVRDSRRDRQADRREREDRREQDRREERERERIEIEEDIRVESVMDTVDSEAPPEDLEVGSQTSSARGDDEKGNGLLHDEEVLESVFKNMPMGCVVITSRGCIAAYSKAAERTFLFKTSEVINENITFLMPKLVAVRHDYFLSRCRNKLTHILNEAYKNWLASQEEEDRPAAKRLNLGDIKHCNDSTMDFCISLIGKQTFFGGRGREMAAIDKGSTTIPIEAQVMGILVKGVLHFLGFITDLREIGKFQQQTVRQERLLQSLIDEKTLGRVLKGHTNITDYISSASVLFCDIVSYTEKTNLLHPEEVVDLLNELFSMFDKVVTSYGSVEKIKTIGDCYMACCGCPNPNADHAATLTQVGLDFLHSLNMWNHHVADNRPLSSLLYSKTELRKMKSMPGVMEGLDSSTWRKRVHPITVRVGIHSGPLMGGVFSNVKGHYDLCGETVNIAAKMESNGPHMSVHVSRDTYNLLPKELQADAEQRAVEIKGLGRMTTYFLK